MYNQTKRTQKCHEMLGSLDLQVFEHVSVQCSLLINSRSHACYENDTSQFNPSGSHFT